MKCHSFAVENANMQESKANSGIHILSADLADLPYWFQGLHEPRGPAGFVGHPRNVKDPHPQKECGGLSSGLLVFLLGKSDPRQSPTR